MQTRTGHLAFAENVRCKQVEMLIVYMKAFEAPEMAKVRFSLIEKHKDET